MPMNTPRERLAHAAYVKGISVSQFEVQCGLPHGYVGKLKDKNPTARKMHDITHRFPDISYDWILTGEGEPPKKEPTINASSSNVYSPNAVVGTGFKEALQMADEYIQSLKDEIKHLRELNNELISQINNK